MTRRTRSPASFAAAAAFLVTAAPGGAEGLHPRDLKAPPLDFGGINPETFTTRQGVRLIVLEDREQPTFSFSGMFRAGSAYDPPGKEGLAELVARVARTGGVGRFTGAALDDELDFAAAHLGLSAGAQAVTVSGRCLTRDRDLLLEALRGVFTAPKFAPEKIEEARAMQLDALRRQNDEPGPIARRELKKIVYGADSPWARTPTPASLRAITREDVVAFHAKYYRPNHLVFGVTGDFGAVAMGERLEEAFEGWEKGEVPALPAPTTEAPQPGVYLARKKVNQTTVRMGHLGLPLHHPDYHACQVMNRILGLGTFTSRMGIEIRSNRGLAYSVGSGIFEGRGPGMFIAVAGTKAESTHEVVGLMRQIIAGMAAGVTEKELSDAKKTLLNKWVFEFDSGAKIVATKVEHEFFAYPADTLKEYPEKIAAVTRADVQRAAKAHLRPADLAVFLVGDPAAMGKPVSELGQVIEVALPETP